MAGRLLDTRTDGPDGRPWMRSSSGDDRRFVLQLEDNELKWTVPNGVNLILRHLPINCPAQAFVCPCVCGSVVHDGPVAPSCVVICYEKFVSFWRQASLLDFEDAPDGLGSGGGDGGLLSGATGGASN